MGQFAVVTHVADDDLAGSPALIATMRPVTLVVLGCFALWGALLMGLPQSSEESSASDSRTYKGLTLTAKAVERSKNVSLQDCPSGANTVRGVIRPSEETEFVTVELDVSVLPSFETVALAKPVLYDEAGAAYKTAQSFGELNAKSYTCRFSFRLPQGTKVKRFAVGEASLDLTSLEK